MNRAPYDDPRWPWRNSAAASRVPPASDWWADRQHERMEQRRHFAAAPPKSFAHSLGTSLLWAAVWAVAATGYLALASAGLWSTRGGESVPADADAASFALVAVTAVWAYGFGQLAGRILAHPGGHLASLAALGVIASACVATLVTMMWPGLMDPTVPTGSVLLGIGRNPTDTLVVLLLFTSTSAWLVALFLPLAAWGLAFPLLLGTIARIPVYLLGVFAVTMPISWLVDGPVGTFEGVVLTCSAASGVAVAALVASVMSRPGAVVVPPPSHRRGWLRRRGG